MRHRYLTADVFTDRIFGGNQLAVVPDARGLTTSQMLAITREFNYSETSFVLPPDDSAHTRRVRIFTPGREMAFAGHPTIGTAFVLASLGEIPLGEATTEIVFEEGAGPVNVGIEAEEGRPGTVWLSPPRLPEHAPSPVASAVLADALSLEVIDLVGERWAPEVVSCGEPFIFVSVRDRATLGRSAVNPVVWKEHFGGLDVDNLYVYCFDPEREGSTARVRMFAPSLGVGEDPATGAAASAFAGVLARELIGSEGEARWVVEQGFEMGRPSILVIEARVSGGRLESVRVGGRSVVVMDGEIELGD